jgi:hypothetical protein
MRLSELIQGVRHKVNDAAGKYHGDSDVAYWLNRHQRSLYRRKVDADGSYGLVYLDVDAGDTKRVRQVATDRWRYYLPAWAYRVGDVFDPTSFDSGGLWRMLDRSLWSHSSNRSIDVISPAAKSLRFSISKVPALMRPLSVAVNSTRADEIILPLSTTGYAHELEDGSMLGAAIEITDPSALACGTVSVIEKSRREKVGGADVWVCSVVPPFTDAPQAGNPVEMHAEIEDVHVEYLIALAARSLFERTSNLAGVQVLRETIYHCEQRFVAGLQPRSTGQIHQVRLPEEDSGASPDPERAPTLPGWTSW